MLLDITTDEAQYIVQVLGYRPFSEVANLINKVAVQVRDELAPKNGADTVVTAQSTAATPAAAE